MTPPAFVVISSWNMPELGVKKTLDFLSVIG
jgi:hypothetical protein